MKALRFYGARDVRFEDVAAPTPDLGPRSFVRTRWCGICGTDLHEYVAGPLQIPKQPQILGHEFAGDIDAVGTAVTSVRPGDRVSVMPLGYCGTCHFCRRGMNNLCASMTCVGLMTPWGGFASAAVVQDYQAWPLPDSVSYEQGALIEPAAAAAYGVQRASVQPGDSVLVTGGGPIGQLAMLASFAAGAVAVSVSEPNAHRRALALALGATQAFDPSDTEIEERLREQTGGLGVDAAIECAGFESALRTCLAAVRPRGTVAQVGLHL